MDSLDYSLFPYAVLDVLITKAYIRKGLKGKQLGVKVLSRIAKDNSITDFIKYFECQSIEPTEIQMLALLLVKNLDKYVCFNID